VVPPAPRSQLSRAFRQSSLRVHPDKNPSAGARAAFDALNATQRLLLDRVKQARGRAQRARSACARVLTRAGAGAQADYVREEGERLLQQLTSDQPARARRAAPRSARALTRLTWLRRRR
jgi:hypothetical protein